MRAVASGCGKCRRNGDSSGDRGLRSPTRAIRARRTAGIARLDALVSQVEYLAITTTAMRRAAEIRAAARQRGRPTGADAALDGDVILAGQATTLNRSGLIVAITNVQQLSRFVPAALWSEIT